MPSQIVDLRVKVKINGEEPKLQFHSIEVHQRLFEPSRFRLEIGYGGEREQGSLADKIGADLVIEIFDAVSNDIAQKHAGRITGFELREDSIILEARSKDYLLTAARRHRTFEKTKISEVVQKIAGEHGLSSKITSTTETFTFLQQYGETDYEFITRLASYCGFAFYHDDEKFYFVKDFDGAESVSVDAGDLMDVVKHCRVEDVVKKSAAYYNAELHNDPGKGEKSAKNFAPDFAGWQDVFPSSLKDEDFNTDMITAGAVSSYVDASAARTASEFERVLGSTINPLVVVGRVAESDDAILKKGHVIIGIDAAFKENGYKANFEARQKTIPISPEPAEVDHSFILQRAVVTNDRDDKKMGRVKVKFAWSAGDESYWAGVLAAGASGDKHGSHFTPRVGDVVLVGFENGDLAHPVVLGSLYTSESPPEFKTENGTEEVLLLQTPVSAIRVVDKDNEETITITMKETKNVIKLELKGPKITIESDGGTVFVHAKTINIKADDKISLEAGNIELSATQNITCKAQGDFKAEATTNATLSGTAKAAVSGAQVEVTASATNTIKGALVQIN